MAYFIDSPDSIWHQPYLDGLDSAVSVLQSMIEEVEEYWEDEEETQPERKKNQKKTIASNSKKIFIIHGHDDGTKETVARFIEQIGLEPVILHEKPNQGRTVIEKFEDYADVGFAIALLTPDDVGNEKNKKDELNPRARQNVIFEFGFFLGQLGRKRVCGIKKNDVEIPSDYKGVLYINLDSEGAWRMQLVQELKAADIDVDANLAF
ncbi:MAG: nucleotide-binding protein [Candidatus Aminicenantes bacterium]|nr:nucleotide-binding protein [Candidatus Aminicenantes bacterium]